MTMPTPPRTLLRIGVGFVVTGGLLASAAVPASAAVAIPAAGAQFILTNMMPVSGPPTPAERSAGVVAARTIGYSVQGRKIVARLYGSPDATRVSVMIGSMHGNEPGGVPVAKRLEKLGAPRGTAMWVIRNLNPDGARSNTRQNANKVDLNRNGTPRESAVSITPALHRHQSRRQRPTFRSSNRSSPTLCSSTTSTETALTATGRRMRA